MRFVVYLKISNVTLLFVNRDGSTTHCGYVNIRLCGHFKSSEYVNYHKLIICQRCIHGTRKFLF